MQHKPGAIKSHAPVPFDAEDCNGRDKHSGKTLETKLSGPHPKRFKMFRWELEIVTSGKSTNPLNSCVLLRTSYSEKHSSRKDAMDSARHVGPNALGDYTDALMGRSAPSESHGSQLGSKSTIGL